MSVYPGDGGGHFARRLDWLAGGTALAEDGLLLKSSVYETDQTAAAAPQPTLEIKPLENLRRRQKNVPAARPLCAAWHPGSERSFSIPSIAIGGVYHDQCRSFADSPRGGSASAPSRRLASPATGVAIPGKVTATFNLDHYPERIRPRHRHEADLFTRYRLDIRRDTYALADAGYILVTVWP